ncbi:MAG: FG-GAP and VCBS repeat-containing protein, partial [Candidatus Sumerlaeota bacterium]|nr:FG-GAP and VCBS repeat-containing protein [Candidatus Sumerlaeota bacterium]
MITGDFNGDGILDLVVTVDTNFLSVLFGNVNGTFALPVPIDYGTGNGGWRLASGDFNGDGHPDLVVADCGYFAPDQPPPGSTVSVLLNNGDGTFAA